MILHEGSFLRVKELLFSLSNIKLNNFWKFSSFSVSDSIDKKININEIYRNYLNIKDAATPNPSTMGKFKVYPYKEYNKDVGKLNPKAFSEGSATIKNLKGGKGENNKTFSKKDLINEVKKLIWEYS